MDQTTDRTDSNVDVAHALRNTFAMVLAGGRGTRLMQLTDRHAKPAIPFGGKYRIIDFPLSNCVNSGIRKVSVVTQYKAHSLLIHMQWAWGFLRAELGEFVEVWPAQQRLGDESWYRGTADAVTQNIDILLPHRPEYILVLAGDHVYKQDYGIMLADHIARGAKVTVGCVEVPRMEATAFGVVGVDEEDNIVSFLEKPADPPGIPDKPESAFASMGIYIFDADFLFEELERDAKVESSSHDFGKDVIPGLLGRRKMIAHRFERSCIVNPAIDESYWRDVGTVDAYYEANIDLCTVTPTLDLYEPDWPIWTYQEQRAPAKFVFDDDNRRGAAVDSLVSSGCIISGAYVARSVLFSSIRAHSYSVIEDSVILPNCDVGRHCRLKRVLVDQDVHIPDGLVVGEDPELDAKRFHRTANGVVLITPEMIAKLSD